MKVGVAGIRGDPVEGEEGLEEDWVGEGGNLDLVVGWLWILNAFSCLHYE